MEKLTATGIARKVSTLGGLTLKQTQCMLRFFRLLHPELPMDPRTLLGTPRLTKKKCIAGGEYIHIGLKKSIQHILLGIDKNDLTEIKFQIHIDGLTLFKSSLLQAWPILGKLTFPPSSVFIIGLFCGKSKPTNVHTYLHDLLVDLREIFNNGIWVPERMNHVPVKLECVVADALARALVLQIKSHSGFYACQRCCIQGKRVHGKNSFSC